MQSSGQCSPCSGCLQKHTSSEGPRFRRDTGGKCSPVAGAAPSPGPPMLGGLLWCCCVSSGVYLLALSVRQGPAGPRPLGGALAETFAFPLEALVFRGRYGSHLRLWRSDCRLRCPGDLSGLWVEACLEGPASATARTTWRPSSCRCAAGARPLYYRALQPPNIFPKRPGKIHLVKMALQPLPRSGGEALLRTLVANGVNVCFTNPGTR